MASSKPRLAYIDWMRGLACLLMFQTHAYDAWLSPTARKSTFFMYSQLLGTFPAPLFLFLAGVSFALVTDKLRSRNADPDEIAKTTIRRGAEVLLFGILFRVQQFLFGVPWSPWTSLFVVDVLSTIGIAMMMLGVLCRLTTHPASIARQRWQTVFAAIAAAIAISMLTPPLWTTWRPRWLTWPLESYINGVYIYKEPTGQFFPIFPWAGFAFVGLATGLVLLSDWARKREATGLTIVAAGGVATIFFARWLTAQPQRLYAVDDYWRTSPSFFLLRVGMLLVILLGSYTWCRWGLGQWGFSPLIQMGQTSLLVYWVHIEFVYGKFSILPKKAMSVAVASAGLAMITTMMVLLSVVHVRTKGHWRDISTWFIKASQPLQRQHDAASLEPKI